ncbi:24323_t:CDS:1, partial [Gigaspora rosea]
MESSIREICVEFLKKDLDLLNEEFEYIIKLFKLFNPDFYDKYIKDYINSRYNYKRDIIANNETNTINSIKVNQNFKQIINIINESDKRDIYLSSFLGLTRIQDLELVDNQLVTQIQFDTKFHYSDLKCYFDDLITGYKIESERIRDYFDENIKNYLNLREIYRYKLLTNNE